MLASSLLTVLSAVLCAKVELTPAAPASAQAFIPAPPATDAAAAPPRSPSAEQNADTETPGLSAPRPASPVVESTGSKRWYGWSLALSDLAFTSIYEYSPSTGARVTSAIGIGLVAPALHFAHRNYTMGSLSLVGRLILVGLMAKVELPASRIEAGRNCHDDPCKLTPDDVLPTLIVSVLGLGFMAVDDFAMARIEEPSHTTVTSAPARAGKSGLSIAPSLGATADGASIALLGRF